VEASARHHFTVDRFFADARRLRRAFDRTLREDQSPFSPGRFVWERWHVDGQFSQYRTPARAFFAAPLLAEFERRLLAWARRAVGLSLLGSPPWLSSVTDGGYQGLHRDSPNGELAFSYGLSRPGARFRGGETLLARPDLLDYWRSGSHRAKAAHLPMWDEIPPRFDRLVVFDARLPHGVRAVEGPRHPRDGRVAIQGWLRPGGCLVDGPLDRERVEATVTAALEGKRLARDLAGAEGLYVTRLGVDRTGRVRGSRALLDWLVSTSPKIEAAARAARAITSALARTRFERRARPSEVTVPILVAENGKLRTAASDYREESLQQRTPVE
jgi:2-oxoglutarate-Fe(II)-dependent oxygenase superfamily protein